MTQILDTIIAHVAMSGLARKVLYQHTNEQNRKELVQILDPNVWLILLLFNSEFQIVSCLPTRILR